MTGMCENFSATISTLVPGVFLCVQGENVKYMTLTFQLFSTPMQHGHGHFPSRGAYFTPLLCLRTQSIKRWRMRFHNNLHLFYSFAVGRIWIRLLCIFSLFMYHRAQTRKIAVIFVLLSAYLAPDTSRALKYLNCNTTEGLKNKLFALTAPKKYPGNQTLKLRIEIICRGIYLQTINIIYRICTVA